MIQVYSIPRNAVGLLWQDVEGFIKKGLERGIKTHEPADLLDMCLNGLANLWVAADEEKAYGAGVATLIQYPRCKGIHVISVGGEKGKEWIDQLIKSVDEFGKHNGCKYITSTGRKGWMRRWGCKPTGYSLYREIA